MLQGAHPPEDNSGFGEVFPHMPYKELQRWSEGLWRGNELSHTEGLVLKLCEKLCCVPGSLSATSHFRPVVSPTPHLILSTGGVHRTEGVAADYIREAKFKEDGKVCTYTNNDFLGTFWMIRKKQKILNSFYFCIFALQAPFVSKAPSKHFRG